MAKPTMGYPTRTAAIRAMLAEGHTVREVADILGISSGTVSGLRISGERKKKASAPAFEGRPPALVDQAEDRIMDLWDAGLSAHRIAADLGVPLRYVQRVLQYMRDTSTDMACSPKAIKIASASLLAAIRRHHPERCA